MKKKMIFISLILLIIFLLITNVQANEQSSLEIENQISASTGFKQMIIMNKLLYLKNIVEQQKI